VQFVLSRAWIPRPAFAMLTIFLLSCVYAIFVGTQDRGAVYAACVLGQTITQSFFLPFWSWRSSSLKGTTGTAFAFGLQSGVGQLGGVIGPQIFLSRYAPTYRVPFGVCLACIVGALLAAAVCWYLTREVEAEVQRVHRGRLKAHREGKLFNGQDIKYES
jgi:nitrate/nitrite transporter NarK